jgi:hypothetical protein
MPMHRSSPPFAVRAGLFAVLLGGLSLACTQSDIAGPEQPAVEALIVPITGFLKCTPLPAATASKYIMPGVWDTLRVGPHRLIFQPGSLTQKTLITATVAAADSSRSVKFGPEGLTFKSGYAPKLQLSVQNCSLLSSTMSIDYTDDKLTTVKEVRYSVVDLFHKLVSAQIGHFSRYAVHY